MNANDLFPNKYLKADDFPFPRTLHIRTVVIEEVGQNKETKPVLYFYDEPKGLILNKTNFGAISTFLQTDETDQWDKQPIELYRDVTLYQGKSTPCIRMRAPQVTQQRQTAVRPANWQPPQPNPAQPVAPATALSDTWEDEAIPDPGEPIPAAARKRR